MTNIAIFGATSAIAEYTTRALVDPGSRFFLVARDVGKLDALIADLKVRGAVHVSTASYDFSNLEGIGDIVDQAIADLGSINQSLVAFGTLSNQEAVEKNPIRIAQEIALNFTAPAILSQRLANHMVERGGLLAVITSVAGDRGRGSNYVYGSAKGGLGLFLQGLRHKLAVAGVEVLDIRPGFVDTPMTRDFPKGPLWAKPQAVGVIIARAMRERKGGKLYVPRFWELIMLVIRNVPTVFFHKTKL
jgi:short-subunit dehydrogenase